MIYFTNDFYILTFQKPLMNKQYREYISKYTQVDITQIEKKHFIFQNLQQREV